MKNEINFIKKYPQVLVRESGMIQDDVETKVRTAITYIRKKVNGVYRFVEVRHDAVFTEEGQWCKDAMPRFYEKVLDAINADYNREYQPWENDGILDTNQED